MTAEKARKLSSKFEEIHYTKLSDVLKFIRVEATNGHTNTFVDGSMQNLKKFEKALQKRGFRASIETYTKTPFLSVEW